MGSGSGIMGFRPTFLHIPADLVEQCIQHADTKYSTSSKWQAEHEGQVGAILPFLLKERGPQITGGLRIVGGHQSKDMYIEYVYMWYVMHMCVHVHVVLHACIFVCMCGMSMGAWYVCMCLSIVCTWYVHMDVCLHTSTDFWPAGLNIQLHLPRHIQGQSLGRVWALRRNWDPGPVRYLLYLEPKASHMLGRHAILGHTPSMRFSIILTI